MWTGYPGAHGLDGQMCAHFLACCTLEIKQTVFKQNGPNFPWTDSSITDTQTSFYGSYASVITDFVHT